MSLLAKSAIAATVISAGSAVTAHQLIQNKGSDSTSTQQPTDSNTLEVEEQKKVEPEQQITKPQKPTTKRTPPALPPRPSTSQRLEHTSKPAISAASIPAGSIFDRSRFFGHSGKNTPSRINSIEFKPIEGRDRPTWLDQLPNTKGSCQDDNGIKCEWSDILKAHVPKEKRLKLEQSAMDHATDKCSKINGRMHDDTQTKRKGWQTCHYSENYYAREASFYDLNLDNKELYE
ncbi:hypothetical protein [Candidatus Mycoplasma haematohominis]|uniref:Uncharacterized protein n=1 Tax=Candidatus Mycoplasma haematohominis TaxID=1494318 RepID=A0A478FP78_9MOLU|nr:hypothetical protein [Candidatus Mycoplasma haemohominis]GCE63103.1 hypothetical protein MHSWG343_00810 [Candidatus Mycoplasma haemohominis]